MSATPSTSTGRGPGEAPVGPTTPDNTKLDRELMLVACVVVLGAIMSILDVTVVNVAIKTLAVDFKTSLTTIQWVSTGYTLALATVIPLTGWGADRFGTKRIYMTSIALFVLGSAMSGLAWSAGALIGFRVLQGLGGGMLMPAGMTILTRQAGPQRLGRVMSVIGVPMLLGPVLGPVLGGWLVDDASWRWIFFINLPIGILALVLALRILPTDVPAPNHRLDWLGLVLLSPGLAAIIYGLAESASHGGFSEARAWVPALAGAICLVAFIWHASHTHDALIDLNLFRNRVFSTGVGTMMLMVISVFGGMLLVPLYLQLVRGQSAVHTGLLMAPQGLGAMIAMPIAGMLVDRTGVGRIAPAGLATVAVSFLGLTQLTADMSYWQFGGILFLMGIGMGFSMMPLMTGAMQTLRKASVARASTTLNITQQVGASIGTAVMSVILTNQLTDRLGSGGSGGLGGTAAALAKLPLAMQRVILAKMADAFAATFWYALVLVVAAIVVGLVLLPKRKPAPVQDYGEETEVAAAMVLG